MDRAAGAAAATTGAAATTALRKDLSARRQRERGSGNQ
jgi:hypothetical protein